MDESVGTCNKHFAALDISQTGNMHRKYRKLSPFSFTVGGHFLKGLIEEVKAQTDNWDKERRVVIIRQCVDISPKLPESYRYAAYITNSKLSSVPGLGLMVNVHIELQLSVGFHNRRFIVKN